MSNDTRVWSTTLRGLVGIHEELLRAGVPSTSARHLQKILQKNGVYPARDLSNLCTSDPPDAFFTYHSADNFVDIEGIASQACDFAARLLQSRRPEIEARDLNAFASDGIRLWIDFVFIDQSARDIRSELDVLPHLLETVKAHFVLGQVPLTRAWCCYEIALINQHCATSDSPLMRSFIAPTRNLYFGWDSVECTEPEDKAFIAERIATSFPLAFDGFRRVMDQASATAVLNTTESSTFYTPAALDSLGAAAEEWYARYIEKLG